MAFFAIRPWYKIPGLMAFAGIPNLSRYYVGLRNSAAKPRVRLRPLAAIRF